MSHNVDIVRNAVVRQM